MDSEIEKELSSLLSNRSNRPDSMRLMPWDGSFTPPTLSLGSSQVEEVFQSSWLCGNCRTFADWLQVQRELVKASEPPHSVGSPWISSWKWDADDERGDDEGEVEIEREDDDEREDNNKREVEIKTEADDEEEDDDEREDGGEGEGDGGLLEFSLFPDYLSFCESYKRGCHLCTILFQKFVINLDAPSIQTFSFEEKVELWIQDCVMCYNNRHEWDIIAKSFDENRDLFASGPCMRITQITQQSDGGISNDLWGVQIPVYTGSQSMIRLVEEWFQRCRSLHHLCSVSLDSGFRPLRLLNLSKEEGKLQVKLVETDGRIKNLQYVTLSYCWGGKNTLVLQQTNIEALKTAIPMDDLPQTVQDAVQVTHALGFSYIWVDALCIIQDLREDWLAQSKQMASVYGCSILTIAASGATACDEGLFTIRDPLLVSPCKVFDEPGVASGTSENILFPFEATSSTTREEPLYNRGWVLQERLFAPRTINFGVNVTFECREQVLSEAMPRGESANSFKLSPYDNFVHDASDASDVMSLWMHRIVPKYSTTELTYNTDRYAAISGLIEYLSRRTGWKNVFGFWDHYFIEQLAWETGRESLENAKDVKRFGIGPSWSWLDLHRSVTFPWPAEVWGKTKLAEGERIEEVWSEDRKLLIRATLTIKARIFRLTLAPPTGPNWNVGIQGKIFDDWYFSPDYFPLPRGWRESSWFLPILTFRESGRNPLLKGLVIMESAVFPGMYQRVGYVEAMLGFSRDLRVAMESQPTEKIILV